MEEFTNMQSPGDAQPGQSGSSNMNTEHIQKGLAKNRIKKMSGKKKWLLILGILFLFIAGGYGLKSYMGNGSDPNYLTMKVGKGTVADSIEATGTLNPVKKSEMGFKNDEMITAINVQPGDHVKKGQILAAQEATNLNSVLQQAIRTVEQDQINIKSANLNLDNYKRTLEQQQRLFDAGVISESELIAASDNVSKSEWEIATAQSKLLNDQVKVEQARSDLECATLAAPFDGIIGAVNGQVGQINGINSNSSTLLTVISEDLELSALVNEADIGKVKVGQDVEFTSSSYGDRVFKGKVLRITPQAQTVSNVQYYPVLISCVDPEHKLFSGMSVSVNIIVARQTDVLTVSMMAVSYAQANVKNNPAMAGQISSSQARSEQTNQRTMEKREQGTNQGERQSTDRAEIQKSETRRSRVMVLENNQAVSKRVVLGLSDGSNYEVIEGLNEGDQVIVGTNQAAGSDSQTAGSRNSNTRSYNNNRNQSGSGGGMGGPPPGF